jgi:RNA polymerase sigma-70 factor (ECF subfamily)
MNQEEENKIRTEFDDAHRDHSRGLNLHAFFKTSSHVIGEDLVQDTFIKTWRYLVRGGKIDIMRAFLYHILNNLIVDEYRKRKTTSLDILLGKGFEPNTGDPKRIFDILDGKAMFLLIGRLPQTYQKVMHMKYVQDLSLKEMSILTGQSKNTIAVQVHRGLEKLKLLHSSI